MYGAGMELKQFAIRVLSLTCSATGCERNWSIFQHIHSKRRARMEHERLNNLVFIKYNIKLERRQREREKQGDHYDPISLSDMESDDEWITEKEAPTLANEASDFSWMEISDCLREDEGGSGSCKKKKRGIIVKYLIMFLYFIIFKNI
jgi:hAT family C-terminal dimerisation region